ncbi:MAG: hypothetical protein U0670_10400 [Anaerolineae bacterium]
MKTIAQTTTLLKELALLLQAQRSVAGQQRVFERIVALVLAEVFALSRHTVSQLLMTLGQTEWDWSAWYRVFSQRRFNIERANAQVFAETLQHVEASAVYVVAGDGTQTARSSAKLEGVGWLRNLRTPAFRVGIHHAQRWFNGSWLVPAEQGYSRALPLRWLPAFTEKAHRAVESACKEWEAALDFVRWVVQQLDHHGRVDQRVLLVVDGSFDTLGVWQQVPARVTVLARSAKNRVLHFLPPAVPAQRGRPRLYGERAPSPQAVWQQRDGWQALTLEVRGRLRHLQVKVSPPLLRKGAPHCPLFLIVVRGKSNDHTRREPLPFLVNAVQDAQGQWVLPLLVETLLFWAWQRWEVEVCHRELKSNFGLGNKQCFNPHAAVLSVQWSAWVYALLLLSAYRTWGLLGAPAVPTRWWRGAPRWSLNTLWRALRAELWHTTDFHPLPPSTLGDWGKNRRWLPALANAVLGAARS